MANHALPHLLTDVAATADHLYLHLSALDGTEEFTDSNAAHDSLYRLNRWLTEARIETETLYSLLRSE